MAEPAEGMWQCKVLGGEAAADDRDIITVRINVQIAEGPDSGRKVTYEDRVNNLSAKYILQTCRAVGWRAAGKLEDTLRADVDAWVASTGGASTVEIKHLLIKNGKNAGKTWAKANSLGRGPRPLKAPTKASSDDAHAAMMAAMAEFGDGPPPDNDVPPPDDNDAPPF